MDNIKQNIILIVEKYEKEIIKISHVIHDHPEIGFEEIHACRVLTDVLRAHGFDVKTGLAEMPTSFCASYGHATGPNIAFLAEYDALAALGHACGHNIISAMSVGAGITLKDIMDKFCLCGTITVIGTPAEETTGGKIIMLKAGVFNNIDFSLMAHPTSGANMVMRGSRACASVSIRFSGKLAHSSVQWKGINALSAVIATFNNINSLRPSFMPKDNVNGIITDGGYTSNTVPNSAACEFCLRAETVASLNRLIDRIKNCAMASEFVTGAKVEIKVDSLFSERYPSKPIGEAFKRNLESLGEKVEYADPDGLYASSDISNVSLRMPTIHEYVSIAPANICEHTTEFRDAAISQRGDKVCILGAESLAMTGYDILNNKNLRDEASSFFKEHVPLCYRK